MRESSSASAAHVNRVALIVLRAAAYLIVATGFNEIVVAAVPRYEPLYLYVAVAAVVTLFDGLLFGFPAGLVGIAIYLVLYTRRPIDLSTASWAGLVMFGALLAAAAVRLAWNLRRRDPIPPADEHDDATPLIEASVVTSSDEVVSAIELLRMELRATVSDVSASRERERELHAEIREMRAKLAEARDAEHALRLSAAGEAERIVAGAQSALDQVNARLAQVEESARVREARLEEAYHAARDSAGVRAEQLERENLAFREARRESEAREAALREQLASFAADLEMAKTQLDAAGAERAALAERLEIETQRAAQAAEAAEQTRAGLERAAVEIADLKRDEETLRSATEAAGEAVRRADDMVQTLQAEVAAARTEAERERATRAGLDEQFDIAKRELEAEIRRLTGELAERASEHERVVKSRVAEASLLKAVESDLEALTAVAERERVARAAADEAAASAEAEVIEARTRAEEAAAELAAARAAVASAEEGFAEARAATARLEAEVAEARASAQRVSAELAELRAAAAVTARELSEALAAAEGAKSELAASRAASGRLEQELTLLRNELDAPAGASDPQALAEAEEQIATLRGQYDEMVTRVASLTMQNLTLVEEVRQARDTLAAEARDRDTVVRQLTLRAETAEGAMRIERSSAEAASEAADRYREQLQATSRELDAAIQQRDAYAQELRVEREALADRSENAGTELTEMREVHEQLRLALHEVVQERAALDEKVAAADAVSQKLSMSLADERALRLAADLALTESRTAAETAAEEAAAAKRQLSDLQATHEQAMAAIEQLRRNLDSSREHMESSHQRIAELEDALREALATDDGHAGAEPLREALMAAHESIRTLEEAKLEVESRLTSATAERDSISERFEILEQENEQLRSAAATAQLEFDRKLQEIVTHLAEDHEADVGQAVMEREEARAEARQLMAKLTTVSEQLEIERARWIETRDAMVKRLKQIQSRVVVPAAEEAPMPPRAVEPDRVLQPIALAAVAAPAEPRPEPLEIEQEEPAPARRGPHILVAHPDSQLREAARTRLEEIGYRVTTAADGLEGLRRARAEQPDLVVADSSMPKMDGRELCQMLKSQERTAKIKVVLLARSTADIAGEPGLKPDEILRKPVRFDLLRSSIASLLAHYPS